MSKDLLQEIAAAQERQQIQKCHQHARSAIGDSSVETEFVGCREEGGSLIEFREQRQLYRIRNNLPEYLDAYQAMYQRIKGTNPEQIVIENYFVMIGDNQLHRMNQKVSFSNCKIEVNTQHEHPPLRVEHLKDCDVSLQNSFRTIISPKIESCHFRNRCTIQSAGIEDLQISRSAFTASLTTSSPLILNTCNVSALEVQGPSSKTIINNSKLGTAYLGSRDLILQKTSIEKPNFSNVEFVGSAIFSNVVFKAPPNFTNTHFSSKNVEFDNITFGDTHTGLALGTFRQLKKMCEDAGYGHGVILFHGLELETHYNVSLRKKCPKHLWPEKLGSIFHKAFTDYGRNLMWPLLWLFFFFVLGFGAGFWEYESVVKASTLSFRNSIGPMFIALPEHIRKMDIDAVWLEIISFIQIITCSVIWFVFTLMMRSRFKL